MNIWNSVPHSLLLTLNLQGMKKTINYQTLRHIGDHLDLPLCSSLRNKKVAITPLQIYKSHIFVQKLNFDEISKIF